MAVLSKHSHACYVVTFWTSTNHYVKYYLWQSDIQRYPFFTRVLTLPVGGSISLFVHRGAMLSLPGEREHLSPCDMNVKLTLIEKRDLSTFRILPTVTVTQQICSALVYQSLGDEFFHNKNFAQSLQTYEDALRLISTHSDHTHRRKHGHRSSRDSHDVFAVSDQTFRGSLFGTITLSAATSALMQRAFDVTILYCDQIISREPNHLPAMIRKCQALKMVDKLDQAAELIEKAVKLAPQDPNVIREWRHVRVLLQVVKNNEGKADTPCASEMISDVMYGGSNFIESPTAR